MTKMQMAALVLAVGLLAAGMPTAGLAQTAFPPCPDNSLQSLTAAPASATVMQEQPILITGSMTAKAGAGPCLVHLVLTVYGSDFNFSTQNGQIDSDYASTDFPIGPGTTAYSVDVDQKPNRPLPVDIVTLTVMAVNSPEGRCLFGCNAGSPVGTSLSNIPAGSVTVLPGDASEGETASPPTSPPPSGPPVPVGQIKKCEVQIRVNDTTVEWIRKPLSFCRSARSDEQ